MKKTFMRVSAILSGSVLAFSFISSCGPTDNTSQSSYNNTGTQSSQTSNSQSSQASIAMHAVVFDYNYENGPDPLTVQVKDGATVTKPEDPTRTDYAFLGWYKENSCQNKYDFTVPVRSDLRLYAGWQQSVATVTFDLNYEGSTPITQKVTVGQTASRPSDPSRTGYLFTGWFQDSACLNQFDFSTIITGDLIIYAGWEEKQSNTVEAVFYTNYGDGGTIYYSITVNNGSKIQKPQDPVRDGYYFAGWFTDAACTASFDFNQRVTSDVSLYAKWLKIWTFEAEYTNLDDKLGVGYSANVSGTDMIEKDTCGCGASNGFFVSYLYYYGAFLEFDIASSSAVSDAVMKLRLSVEFYDMYLTSDNYTIEVNGQNLQNYNPIALSGAIPIDQNGSEIKRPFENYLITTSLSLKAGMNTVKLITTNDNFHGGTMQSDAPMVDCLYLCSNSGLSWTPRTDNIVGK